MVDVTAVFQLFLVIAIVITLALIIIYRNSLFLPSPSTFGESENLT